MYILSTITKFKTHTRHEDNNSCVQCGYDIVVALNIDTAFKKCTYPTVYVNLCTLHAQFLYAAWKITMGKRNLKPEIS